jgi:hypothetical protein
VAAVNIGGCTIHRFAGIGISSDVKAELNRFWHYRSEFSYLEQKCLRALGS